MMRVIAGSAKGRRLRAVKGDAVRPTADRVKEALFSILGSRFDLSGTRLLDLFAGSGSIGIEALSRGAAHVTFVEQHAGTCRVLRENLATCGFAERATVRCLAVDRALAQQGVGVLHHGVVLDPPYGRELAAKSLEQLGRSSLLTSDAWVMVEHHADDVLRSEYGFLRLTHSRRYGKTCLSLFQATGDGDCRAERMKKAVYAGSFDPITNGHLNIVRRALAVFDHVVVAVAHNPNKDSSLFSAAERVEMIREALDDVATHITVDAFEGLLVDYAERVGAQTIVRGLRAVSDFEYEFQMSMMNHHLKQRIETVFMIASETYFYTASRLIKEVASLGGDISGFVPPGVHRRLLERVGRR